MAYVSPLPFLHKNTGDTMNKKDKRQTKAIQWTKKTKDKHRQYNGQKRKRTNRCDTMYKKDKRQTQAIQWTKKTKDKHRRYNGQKRQRTNRGNTMDKKENAKTQAPVFVLCLS
jgi:hypothetical protein